ncbi:arabinofuranosidase catalytic domain-containing protein, partial [Streptomyces sp. NPDC127574]
MRRKRSALSRLFPWSASSSTSRLRRALMSVAAAIGLLVTVIVGLPGVAQAAGSQPCDIYAGAGTPCVAAHSTTRALFSAYNGPLY